MKRITVFAKGNVDVYDSLHSCRIGGKVCWNGINEVVRSGRRDVSVRLQYETWTRSDALLAAKGTVPGEAADQGLSLGAYPLASQFSDAIFRTGADAIILSIQPDVTNALERHNRERFLLYPDQYAQWPESNRDWLRRDFTRLGRLDPRESMANFEKIISRIRASSSAPILILNLSPIIPAERVHCFEGLEDIFSTRIRRFNLGLIELSETTGVSIVDVDGLFARAGADRLRVDVLHSTPEGYRLIAEEVVRVLDDLGVLAAEADA